MSNHVIENFDAPAYHFTDPGAFLSCDNLQCSTAWVTATGLVVWAIEEDGPSCSRFTDHLVVACSVECLQAALHAHGRGRHRWSELMPVGDWLDALWTSIDVDPTTTPIGEFAGAV